MKFMEYLARLWLLAQRFPASLRIWRAINSQFRDIYQYLNLIFGSTPTRLPPSHSIETGEAFIDLLKARHEKMTAELDHSTTEGESLSNEELKRRWDKAYRLLQMCPELNSLYDVHNSDGFNCMLMAVIYRDTEILQLLLDEGCDINRGKCTLPLHLACRLGDVDMVQFLLSNGASCEQEAGMCYPMAHKSIRHMPSRFHFLETDVFHCDSDHVLPLMYAIQHDHQPVVQCLMERKMPGGIHHDPWPYNRFPLHQACKYGSYQCINYLICIRPDEINKIDELGITPLLYAVKWGVKFVKLLVESGANVLATGRKNNTALHILYEDIKIPLEVYGTTRYLLATGLEQQINQVDDSQSNILHIIMTLVNRLLVSFGDNVDDRLCRRYNRSVNSVDCVNQKEWDMQLLQCIDLLLKINCDANAVNNNGVTPMHKLLLTLDFVLSSDASGMTMENLPVREMYKVEFSMLYSVLELLLTHKADANMITLTGRTPLMLLLNTLLSVDVGRLCELKQDILDCVVLLCNGGARPSHSLSGHIQVVRTLTRLGHKCLQLREVSQQDIMVKFFNELLATLLTFGLDPNYCSQHRQKLAEGGSGNLLLEIVKLAQYVRHPQHLQHVYCWVLTLLQLGTNPDLEPYSSDPEICHSQSHIYLKEVKGNQAVKQYLDNIQDLNLIVEGDYAESLLMLFYHSMDHKALFHCMTMTRLQSRFDPNSSSGAAFIKLINELLEKPRSLQQIARVSIYKSINRQLMKAVPQLSLPKPLQDYLLYIK